MAAPYRINLFNHQAPFLERHPDGFRVWSNYNSDVSTGSYYHLHDNGRVDLVTVKDREVMNIVRMLEERK